MTAQEIDLLMCLVARTGRAVALRDRWDRESTEKTGPCFDAGWQAALKLAKGPRFPSLLRQQCYRWVTAAAIFVKMGRQPSRRFPDTKIICSVKRLYEAPDGATALRASLFAMDSTAENVAIAFGVSVEVVQAYNDLFFNVLTRKHDHDYRKQIARPRCGRAGDMAGQLSGADSPETLMEIAFNGTLSDVLRAAGRRGPEAIPDSPEAYIRARALAATSEWARSPQRESGIPDLVAFGLELVRKSGFTESEESDDGIGLGDFLAEELAKDAAIIRESINMEIAAISDGISK